jgi:hypothetical protein
MFETKTNEFIKTLGSDQQAILKEIIEWEKELSWSAGYADAVEADEYEKEEKALFKQFMGNDWDTKIQQL